MKQPTTVRNSLKIIFIGPHLKLKAIFFSMEQSLQELIVQIHEKVCMTYFIVLVITAINIFNGILQCNYFIENKIWPYYCLPITTLILNMLVEHLILLSIIGKIIFIFAKMSFIQYFYNLENLQITDELYLENKNYYDTKKLDLKTKKHLKAIRTIDRWHAKF